MADKKFSFQSLFLGIFLGAAVVTSISLFIVKQVQKDNWARISAILTACQLQEISRDWRFKGVNAASEGDGPCLVFRDGKGQEHYLPLSQAYPALFKFEKIGCGSKVHFKLKTEGEILKITSNKPLDYVVPVIE